MRHLKRYIIRYRDEAPGAPTMTLKLWAYSQEHAVEKFEEDAEGYDLLSVAVDKGGMERQR